MTKKGFTIVVSGKGGSGKTLLASLLVDYFSKKGSVLAIDADPDSNLPAALGVAVKRAVGDVREALLGPEDRARPWQTKEQAFEMGIMEIIEETPRFDLVVMGRSEGEGCYCAINHILRRAIDTKAKNYDYVVVDCEAGLEHLSRRTARRIDLMLVVTDVTRNGVLTAKRIGELSQELDVKFGETFVVANKVTPETRQLIEQMCKESGLEVIGYLPFDPGVSQFDLLGKPMLDLPANAPIRDAASKIFERIAGEEGKIGSKGDFDC